MHQHVTLKVRLGTTYKKTAVYSCMTGFTLKGSYRRTYGETGQWSDDAPTCDIKGKAWYHLQEDSSIQLCDRVHTQHTEEHVGKLDSGVMMHQHVILKVRLGTTYKKTAVYSCMTGFTLKGSYRRTYGETGQWSDDAPTCDIKGKAWYHLQEDTVYSCMTQWGNCTAGVMMHQQVTLKVSLGTTTRRQQYTAV